MRYMLDTNICIHLIQRHPRALIARLESLAYGDVGISAIVLAELRHGVESRIKEAGSKGPGSRYPCSFRFSSSIG
jgi:tRNA(fMet)-specific endonuclease VapC